MPDAGVTASIVVLTHNRREALGKCIDAIMAKTRTPFELLVVVNGCRDGTLEWLHTLPMANVGAMAGLKIWTMPQNMGVCARNAAMKDARGEFILQVDDDVVVSPGWDESLLGAFSDPRVGAAGQQGFFLNWAGFNKPGRTLFLDHRRPSPGEFVDLVMGYCWAWRNDRLPAYIGQAPQDCPSDYPSVPRFAYDEGFNPHWHEETDLQLQIKAAGYRIRCGPVVSLHRSMKSWRGAHNGDPMIGLQHAILHEQLLQRKWGGRRAELGLELDRRGLQ